MTRSHVFTYLAAAALFAAGPLAAQDSLAPGARIRITAPRLGIYRRVGTLVTTSRGTLMVRFDATADTQALSIAAIVEVEVSRGNNLMLKIAASTAGGAVGLGTVGFVGAALAVQGCHSGGFECLGNLARGGIIGGIIGAVIGVEVGATVAGGEEKWRSAPGLRYPGTRVRFIAPAVQVDRLEGTLVAISAETLVVRFKADGPDYRIPVAHVTELQTLTHTGTHDVAGLLVGLGGGALLGRIIAGKPGYEYFPGGQDHGIAVTTLLGGFVGGLTGAIVGSLTNTSSWEPARGWQVAPRVSFERGRPSLGFSVAF